MPGSPFSSGRKSGRLPIRYHRKDGPPMLSLSKLINGRRNVGRPVTLDPVLDTAPAVSSIPAGVQLLQLPDAPEEAYLGLIMIAHSAVSDPALFAAWVEANPLIAGSLMPANLSTAYVGRYLDNLCHQLMQAFSGVPGPTPLL